MKKINTATANKVIGGSVTCVDTYVWVEGETTIDCKAITTCSDKHGNIVSTSSAPANILNCKQ